MLTMSTTKRDCHPCPIGSQKVTPGTMGSITAITPEARIRCERIPAMEPNMARKKKSAG